MSLSDYNSDKDLNVKIDGVQIDDGLNGFVLPFAIRTVMADIKGALQTSATDTTSGAIMTVGAFGLGASKAPNISDLDDSATPAGFYRYINTTTNVGSRPSGAGDYGYVRVDRYSTDNATQILWDVTIAGDVWVRQWQASAWTEWYKLYSSGNILGTVSQSGGTPTGAVIERGSNANGEYVRFADGTLICTHILAASASATQAWTFPSAFTAAPDAVSGAGVATVARMVTVNTLATTSLNFDCWDSGGARTAAQTCLTAVGRWF